MNIRISMRASIYGLENDDSQWFIGLLPSGFPVVQHTWIRYINEVSLQEIQENLVKLSKGINLQLEYQLKINQNLSNFIYNKCVKNASAVTGSSNSLHVLDLFQIPKSVLHELKIDPSNTSQFDQVVNKLTGYILLNMEKFKSNATVHTWSFDLSPECCQILLELKDKPNTEQSSEKVPVRLDTNPDLPSNWPIARITIGSIPTDSSVNFVMIHQTHSPLKDEMIFFRLESGVNDMLYHLKALSIVANQAMEPAFQNQDYLEYYQSIFHLLGKNSPVSFSTLFVYQIPSSVVQDIQSKFSTNTQTSEMKKYVLANLQELTKQIEKTRDIFLIGLSPECYNLYNRFLQIPSEKKVGKSEQKEKSNVATTGIRERGQANLSSVSTSTTSTTSLAISTVAPSAPSSARKKACCESLMGYFSYFASLWSQSTTAPSSAAVPKTETGIGGMKRGFLLQENAKSDSENKKRL